MQTTLVKILTAVALTVGAVGVHAAPLPDYPTSQISIIPDERKDAGSDGCVQLPGKVYCPELSNCRIDHGLQMSICDVTWVKVWPYWD